MSWYRLVHVLNISIIKQVSVSIFGKGVDFGPQFTLIIFQNILTKFIFVKFKYFHHRFRKIFVAF